MNTTKRRKSSALDLIYCKSKLSYKGDKSNKLNVPALLQSPTLPRPQVSHAAAACRSKGRTLLGHRAAYSTLKNKLATLADSTSHQVTLTLIVCFLL